MPPDQTGNDGGRPPRGDRLARRRLLQALPAAAVLGTATAIATRARAADVPELALACDTTLGPVLLAAARAFAAAGGVRVNVFPTGPGLILPQLERQVQNDIVMTRPATLAAAVQANVVAADAARGAWRNRLVLAVRRGAAPPGAAPGVAPGGALAPDRPIAVSDPTPASDMDGPAILARLGLPAAPVLGVIDTDSVAALVLNGTAGAGLLHMTDLGAHPALQVMRAVPPDVAPPIAYAVAVTTLARRPDPAAFVDFLLSRQAAPLLAAHGLETAA